MTDETQFTDEYFINLTMDYDKRIDDIYCRWAVWCAKSNDRYYIDGKDGHFYTHVRTDNEIAIERKTRQIIEFSLSQEIPITEEGHPTDEWMQYDTYIHEILMDKEHILEANPKTFAEWKESN